MKRLANTYTYVSHVVTFFVTNRSKQSAAKYECSNDFDLEEMMAVSFEIKGENRLL